MIHGEASAGLLVSFLPHLEGMEDSFQSEFLSELLLQGRNLAGAFRGELSKHANTQPIVQEAVRKLKHSFEG